jgi:hypothetical protein
MHMRMKAQLLPPGVKDCGHSRLCAEEFFIFGKGFDGLPSGPKKQAVHHAGVLQTNLIQVMRQGKNEMKIGHIEQFFLLPCYPFFSFECATGRAVPIAAGIIADSVKSTLVTGINMSAQFFGSAKF